MVPRAIFKGSRQILQNQNRLNKSKQAAILPKFNYIHIDIKHTSRLSLTFYSFYFLEKYQTLKVKTTSIKARHLILSGE